MSDKMLTLRLALSDFAKASARLQEAWNECPEALTEAYPFPCDFDEVNSDIQDWKEKNI